MITSAIVYRVAGDRKMAAEMADTLIARDNNRLRVLLADTTNMFRVYRSTKARDADIRLMRIAERVNAPVSAWYRFRRFCALCVLLPVVVLEAALNG